MHLPAAGGAEVSASGTVTIIAGGASVLRVDLKRLPGFVIAVNDSAVHAPVWHACVSMDRLWAENRLAWLCEHNRDRDPPKDVWLRRSAVQNLPEVRDLPWVGVFDCDHTSSTFSDVDGTFNGTNSGAVALNLAWKLRPERVFLLGFDMAKDARGRAYWYPPYPWKTAGTISANKYRGWAHEFDEAASAFASDGCAVYNVSEHSQVHNWPKISPEQFRGMLP